MSEAAFPAGVMSKSMLLAELSRTLPGTALWFGEQPLLDPTQQLSDLYGLTPALTHLMRRLGGDVRNTDVSGFYIKTVEGLEPKASTLNLVRAWLLWCWRDVASELPRDLTPAESDAIESCVALAEASLARPSSEAEQAAARSGLEASRERLEALGIFRLLLALVQDLVAEPLAAAEAAASRRAAITASLRKAHGWSLQDDETFTRRSMELHAVAAAKVPEMTPENVHEVFPLYKAEMRVLAAADAEVTEMKARSEALSFETEIAVEEWLEPAREALVALAAAQA
ncbi:hypothetical protein [Caulobacter sp.]|uniref:hypothetical protein n=1 Tax=Caulobacter sp. TaxID=78 RepID=UPI0031D9B160